MRKWLPKASRQEVEKSGLSLDSLELPFRPLPPSGGLSLGPVKVCPWITGLAASRTNQFTVRSRGPSASGQQEGADQQGNQMRTFPSSRKYRKRDPRKVVA